MSVPKAVLGFETHDLAPALTGGQDRISVSPGASFLQKLLAFSGPGYLVSVGYMDPGNWATDLAGGSRFGYLLLSIVLLSNLMAILLQALAAKLGIATGRDLAQTCRDHFSPPIALLFWASCELAIVACDLAEVIGSAIALQLLFAIPLIVGVCLTAGDVMLVLLLQQKGFRRLEAVVIALIVLIGICFALQLALAQPNLSASFHALLPSPRLLTNPDALYIAVGIIGATVMPHNLYLHSSIVRSRHIGDSVEARHDAVRFATIDSTLALTFAFFINAAILMLAAATFHHSGHQDVADLSQAYQLLTPLLGSAMASLLFALALLAAGQSSTITGTLAGQIAMEGFLNLKMQPWLRRLITRLTAIVPAIIATSYYGEKGIASLLIFSQVVLSLQLPFAAIPLVLFTADSKRMGSFVNRKAITWLAWLVVAIIIGLNLYMLWSTVAR